MRAWASLSFFSDVCSASSIAESWRRNAAICWLSNSTWESARAEICFWLSSSLVSVLTLPWAAAAPGPTPS